MSHFTKSPHSGYWSVAITIINHLSDSNKCSSELLLKQIEHLAINSINASLIAARPAHHPKFVNHFDVCKYLALIFLVKRVTVLL
jgi:hypothetical protein